MLKIKGIPHFLQLQIPEKNIKTLFSEVYSRIKLILLPPQKKKRDKITFHGYWQLVKINLLTLYPKGRYLRSADISSGKGEGSHRKGSADFDFAEI